MFLTMQRRVVDVEIVSAGGSLDVEQHRRQRPTSIQFWWHGLFLVFY
jgi:hypothetical protein